MTRLNFAAQPAPQEPRWPVVGKGWNAKNGKGIQITIGNARSVADDNGGKKLEETISELVLTPGSRLYLAPSGFKAVEGKNPPQWLLKSVPDKE